MNTIVTVNWLNENLNNKDLVILDASLGSTVDGKASELQGKTIPGARFFDLKRDFSDPDAEFPNTLPSADQFEKGCRELGIKNSSTIVVFDSLGIYSSPRVWWMFNAMGHKDVFVLDGGLPKWNEMGFNMTDLTTDNYPSGDFSASFDETLCLKYEDILDNLAAKKYTITDARSEGRFKGTEKEPRKGLQSGHIPGSINIPYQDVLENGCFKSKEELEVIFRHSNDQKEPLAFSCGSGLTACIILLASVIAGNDNLAVYDGSWTEWAELQGLKE